MVTLAAQASPVLVALRQSPFPALRKLSILESDRSVTILGCVASYYLKQLAQETIMPVISNRELHNQVMVMR